MTNEASSARRTIARSILVGIGLSAMLLAGPALADRDDRRGGKWRGHDTGRFHDRDVRRFDHHDREAWRRGRWHHGRRDDRVGWWWIVGALWTFYPEPVYPYPEPYGPPVAVAPTSAVYYYCRYPAGYFPSVSVCRVPWQAVSPPAW